MTKQNRMWLWLTGCCLALSPFGCGIDGGLNDPKPAILGTIVSSPALSLEDNFDVPAITTANAFFVELTDGGPLSGAMVSILTDEVKVRLAERGDEPAHYQATAFDQPDLSYVEGAEYVFSARDKSGTLQYRGSVRSPERVSPESLRINPPSPPLDEFPNIRRHPRGVELTIEWPQQNGTRAYVTVLRANPGTPSQPEIIFDSPPRDSAASIEDLFFSPSERVIVPSDTFSTDGIFAVIVATMDLGDPFLLAGTAVTILLAVGDARP